MSKTIFLAAAAALALVAGLDATASAQSNNSGAAAAAAANAQLLQAQKDIQAKFAAEQPYTQEGNSSGDYLFTTYNKLNQDIWVTYYNAVTGNHAGEACIPPGKSAGIASPYWGTVPAYVQVEVKNSFRCGGDNVSQNYSGKYGAGNGYQITKTGTSHLTVTGTASNPVFTFVQ